MKHVGIGHVSVWNATEIGLATGHHPYKVQIDEMMVGGHDSRAKISTKCGDQLMIPVLHQTFQDSVNDPLWAIFVTLITPVSPEV